MRNVFDLGGNVGNLFYSYQSKLSFPATLTWTVYDPAHEEAPWRKN